MATTDRYDAIVIGAGQAGVPLARALGGAGRKTALLEQDEVGGTCINVGCTPTKTMVASARVAYLARRGADYGVRTGSVEVDLLRVRQRKRDLVVTFRSGSQRRLESTSGLDLIKGRARFLAPRRLEVHGADGAVRQLSADLIFINSGARPAVPALPGLSGLPFLDSTSIMELGSVPDHLLVLGGGYVGLEFGQMFRRFGSRVTVIHRGPYLLGREDPDVAEEVARILREDGLEVLLEAEAREVQPAPEGCRVRVGTPQGERTVTGSHLLVATGRVPNTEDLDLAAAGIETDPGGFIRVDERLETKAPGVYALGDVKGGPAFTHIAYDDFRIARTNLLEGGHATTAGRLVPYTVFLDPQLGRVGLSETEARARGHRVRVARLPMSQVARAREVDETRGFMKAVVEADSGRILGAAILGLEGGEVMSVVQVAMMGGLPYTVLREAVFAHPTLAESLNNLFLAMDAA
ncbi:MAG TPA: mercuric reductase [Vicinamibacteria bacterium]|nr:mercuric reductase [Vicinamibacteria bacterium]